MIDEQPISIGADLGWGVTAPLDNDAAVDTVLNDIATRVGPSGHQVIAGIGPYYSDGSCQPVLFLGLTHDQPGAYLRCDSAIGHEPGYDHRPDAAVMFDDGIDGEIPIEADLIRVSHERARQAVWEYVVTQKRPASVEWIPLDRLDIICQR